MANDINRVIISGRATRDPEVRRTQSGMAIMSFGIAVNDRKKNPQTGEWEDVAGFYDCTMFGNRAESLANFIAKGMQLMIEGKLRWSKWERDGVTKSKVEIIAEEVVLPPRQNDQGGAQAQYQPQAGAYQPQGQHAPQTPPRQPQYAPQQAPQRAQQPMPQGSPQVELAPSIYDEDIPFGG